MTLPDVYAFYSVKGGVGKSALAIAAALGFAERGRAVAVLDADLMGTSLADGLALCAPDLADADGQLRWTDTGSGRLTRAQTLQARRRPGSQRVNLPFLDTLLLEPETTFDPAAVAWQHPDLPAVWWYPSSPRLHDAAQAANSVFYGSSERLTRRLLEVTLQIAGAMGTEPVVLIDLPPALVGLPQLAIDAFGSSPDIERFVPVLVTTPDRNDLYRSVEVFFEFRRSLYDMRWLLNRNQKAVESVRREIRDFLGPQWKTSGVENQLHDVGWSGEGLGRLYQQDALSLPHSVTSRVFDLLTGWQT